MIRATKKLNGEGKKILKELKRDFITEDLGYIIEQVNEGKEVEFKDGLEYVTERFPKLDIDTASVVAWKLEVFQSCLIEELRDVLEG